MSGTISVPNTFGAVTSGTTPQLDANFTALVNAFNNPLTYAIYAVDSGAVNAYAITLAPAPSSQASLLGVAIAFKANNANTLASTLNVNALGVQTIVARGGAALAAGQIPLNAVSVVIWDGTNYQLQSGGGKQPTRQTFLSGSGTYTTPAGATRIYVRMIGGGGGGAGSGAGPGAATGGGNTTFSTLTAFSGGAASTVTGGGGGGGSNGDLNITGGSGATAGTVNVSWGGPGGVSVFGGQGPAGGPGAAPSVGAVANTGAGGGGAGQNVTASAGGGGGAGGYVEKTLVTPAATYSYGVGAGGTAGTAGGGGANGAAGGSGIIIVDEFYS